MSHPPTPAAVPPAVREFERRVNWSAVRSALFIVMLLSLGAIALWSRIAPPRTAIGLPDDPGVREAQALLEGRLRAPAVDLRFSSALGGDVAFPAAPGPGRDALERARTQLALTRERNPLDPRVLAALAHVESALRRTHQAESHYRLALEIVPHYGEARLGLGALLAHRSNLATDPIERRRLGLQALAQFAAVRADDPVYPSALHNRALYAARAGRADEAARLAGAYLEIDPSGPWADHLRAAVAAP